MGDKVNSYLIQNTEAEPRSRILQGRTTVLPEDQNIQLRVYAGCTVQDSTTRQKNCTA
jgi:hypothetical protein